MRILFIHPNYHSGGAEIAGNWPPTWVAYLTGALKTAAMDRAELLDRVMHNYRRFYMIKVLFSYPWAVSGERRCYLLGCLKAFLKAGFERKFYDLGKVNYWGPQSKKKVDFHFDPKRTRVAEGGTDWKAKHIRTTDDIGT
ncbi:hypothetical protein [Thiocapsa sp.]|uniref:hypothetical protein n=1 Tax=Thiocapsa sp. TaxID=2024551 RepID=UPI0035936594